MKQRIKKNIRIARLVIYKETLIDHKEHFWTFVGAFLGIGLIGFIQSFLLSDTDNLFLIGSFGASGVLIYGVIQSPLAQPRNLIGGHLLCAFIGVTVQKAFPDTLWLAAALSVSLSIVVMQITKTLHPPGGATALIANIGSEKIQSLGYLYVLSPVLSGAIVLLLVALIFNNTTTSRSYPLNKQWYKFWKRNYLS
ncbi:MAG: HPP family protein [Bacteroidetes bacterium]|nr:HPP family protein [Bacteroidota bacterium]